MLSGGAPCQSFSYAGKRLGLDDARGTLFYHFALFLEKLLPKTFLFENVKGLLSHNHGKTYQTIIEIFENTGYTIQKRVLNAWDYGVAQKRERLITIGVRNDVKDQIKVQFPVPHQYKPVLRDILQDVPPSECAQYGEYKREIFAMVPPGGYWRDINEEVAKQYMKSCWDMGGGRTGILRRLSMEEPSLAVLTSPSQKQTDRCHPVDARPFSVRENARCQSFPDDWTFYGSVASQYRQVGNAVPVLLAYEIASEICKALKGENAMWPLNFISEDDFTRHVQLTIEHYGAKLKSYNLKRFNKNLIDPIKLLFDKNVYHFSWEEIVKNEIFRQRDKANNNDIGYFHQGIFQYIKDCSVPASGWDVIVRRENGIVMPDGDKVKTVYVEMKNKHNTMNDASSSKTYMKMQGQLLSDDDCICCLVEAIAKKSQNITWSVSVDGQQQKHRRIRRLSMDAFYELVTGEKDAFYQMCRVLPSIIESVVKNTNTIEIPNDTVIEELRSTAKEEDGSILVALYMLGFGSYIGFCAE